MKSLNINEMRDQITDAHRKLSARVTTDDLEQAKRELKELIANLSERSGFQGGQIKQLESSNEENKEGLWKMSQKVSYTSLANVSS